VISADLEGRTVAVMNESEHPKEQGHDAFHDVGSEREPHKSRKSVVAWIAVIAIVIILFGLMVVLHTTGTLGPGTH
jgi:hypothetical protein